MGAHVKLSTMLEVLAAATQAHHVESKFEQRGGIFVVAPPGHLKTTILTVVGKQPGIRCMTDITITQLSRMRDEIAGGRVHSLVFFDFQKLFERKIDTALNVVGGIRALVDEGFTVAGHEDSMVSEMPARAFVMGAITPTFARHRIQEWRENGFARRFLFPTYSLSEPRILVDAILHEKPIEMRDVFMIPLGMIPMEVKKDEHRRLEMVVSEGYGDETPLILLKKILSVMRWRRRQLRQKDDALEVLMEWCTMLGHRGGKLDIPTAKEDGDAF